ncbi:MAG TPA: copper transporter [Firmicutes bacterium]|nr:copper transporter [Bacillota bacterium]
MIIDFRYHIASLVAVFLALGLGILIGTAALGERVLVRQQSQLIERLESDVSRMTNERRELQKELASQRERFRQAERFGRAVLPFLVADRLYGRRVAVIRLNPGSAETRPGDDELLATLKRAGAEVTRVLVFLQSPAALEPEQRAGVAKILGIAPESEELPGETLRGLARELARGTPSLLTSYLVDAQVLSASGGTKAPAQVAVVVGGAEEGGRAEAVRTLDLPLIDALRQVGLTVAAVERSDVAVSLVKSYRTKGVLTVDNIDTPAGQVALVMGLALGKTGNFGVKETARQLLPLSGEAGLP